MQVDRIDTDTINITLANHEAGLLLNVLGMVSDVSLAEPLDRLFNLLIDRAIDPQGTVTIEENPCYEGDDDEVGETPYNIVVED